MQQFTLEGQAESFSESFSEDFAAAAAAGDLSPALSPHAVSTQPWAKQDTAPPGPEERVRHRWRPLLAGRGRRHDGRSRADPTARGARRSALALLLAVALAPAGC